MARQVFFDPFGRAAEGYNQGMQQEQNLQANMRTARAQDWDYNNMAPYRLAATQRANTLETSALPFQMQMAPIGLDEAKTALATHQLPLAEQWFHTTGQFSPYSAVFQREFGLNPVSRDQNGNISYTMRGPNGEPVPVGTANPQTAMNVESLPQQMEWARNQAMINYYNGMAQYGRGGIGAYTWDMARAANLQAPGQGASPIDRFLGPQTTAPQPSQQPMTAPTISPYNLPQPGATQPPVNMNNITPQQLQQYDYGY